MIITRGLPKRLITRGFGISEIVREIVEIASKVKNVIKMRSVVYGED